MSRKKICFGTAYGDSSWKRTSRRFRFFFERFGVNRKLKDRMFVMLFSDRKRLLELYNALNDSAYMDEAELTITTIDDAVYMGMKNDCSFIVGNQLNLYEHQSTFCANMPLRGLIYLVDIYQAYIELHEYNIYGKKLIKLPAPRYVVFYNGTEERPDKEILQLSEAFEGDADCLEFRAVMYNINYGHNQKLMEQCKVLEDYAIFIETIRKYQQKGYLLKLAVELAVRDCIEQDILREFLIKNRSEVLSVLLTEYNEKKHIRMEREDAYDEGKAEGKTELLVAMIRRKADQGMPASEIADLFELDTQYVEDIVKLLKEDVSRTDEQIAGLLL